MDDILLASDSDSDDEQSNFEKDEPVATVEQAAAEAAAKLKKEQEMREQRELQMKRLQIQKQQQEMAAKKERQRQQQQAAAAKAAAAKAAVEKQKNSRHLGMSSSSFNAPTNLHSTTPSLHSSGSTNQSTSVLKPTNTNSNISNYGMRTHSMPNQSQRTHHSSTHASSNQNMLNNSQSSVLPKTSLTGADISSIEPTPLNKLIKRTPVPGQSQTHKSSNQFSTNPHYLQTHSSNPNKQGQQSRQQHSHAGNVSSSSHHVSSTSAQIKSDKKEHFLLFTKVLMKYLEQKDKPMHERAKAVIRECAEKNKRRDPKYMSLTKAMQTRLHETVGPEYWRKANDYLIHYMKQNKRKAAAAAALAAGGAVTSKQHQQQQTLQMQQSMMQQRSNPSQSISSGSGSSNTMKTGPANSYPLQNQMSSNSQQPISQTQRPGPTNSHSSMSNQPGLVYQTPTNMAPNKKTGKPTIVKKPIKAKSTHIQTQKVNREAFDNAQKIFSGMTPAQQKAHMAARNAALGPSTSSSSTSSSTTPPMTHHTNLVVGQASVGSNSKKNSMNTPPFVNNPNMMKTGNMMPNMSKVGSSTSLSNSLATSNSVKGVVPGATGVRAPNLSTPPNVAGVAVAAASAGGRGKKNEAIKNKLKKDDSDSRTKGKSAAGIMGATPKVNTLGPGINYTLPGTKSTTVSAKSKADPYKLKEYEELMEQLDHASLFDWKNAIAIVPKEILMEEQRNLLYGLKKIPDREKMKNVIDPNVNTSSSQSSVSTGPLLGKVSSWHMRCKGWGKNNIVSPTIAWAKLRLLEEEEDVRVEKEEQLLSPSYYRPGPILSSDIETKKSSEQTSASGLASIASSPYSWFNEVKAEEDPALALLSEATQSFIRSLLEEAVCSARHRQNIDGTRLWYAHHGSKAYPLTLRLGCDVKRQVALAQGNAAKTSQRLEDALSRSTPKNYEHTEADDQKMLYLSTSMYDLSKHPLKLENAPMKAELEAKRNFEIYGGKRSREPPFGRVPAKKCRVMVKDFQSSMINASFPWKMKSLTASSFI